MSYRLVLRRLKVKPSQSRKYPGRLSGGPPGLAVGFQVWTHPRRKTPSWRAAKSFSSGSSGRPSSRYAPDERTQQRHAHQHRAKKTATTVWDSSSFIHVSASGDVDVLPKQELLSRSVDELAALVPKLRALTVSTNGSVPPRELLKRIEAE